jgi:hypothetical protein
VTTVKPLSAQVTGMRTRTGPASPAWLALLWVKPKTSSRTATPRTCGPASTTTPPRSLRCPEGNVAGQRPCRAPSRIIASPGWIPAART